MVTPIDFVTIMTLIFFFPDYLSIVNTTGSCGNKLSQAHMLS